MSRNGKDNFYRTLKLDKKTKQVMRDFNKIKQEMLNDIENEEEDDK